MLSTNFSEESIEKVNKILQFVLENKHSNFYRQKYEQADFYPIKSYSDFQKIPFLTKDEIKNVPLEKRTFIPEEEIAYYSFSSGTSSKLPIVIPFQGYDEEKFRQQQFNDAEMDELGVDTILVLLIPNSNPLAKFMKMKKGKVLLIPADVNNLPLAAKIATETQIQGIRTTPPRAIALINLLKQNNFDLGKIKWIRLSGDNCNKLMYDRIKLSLPNAFIKLSYGNSEVGGQIGARCKNLDKSGRPGFFHPSPSIFETIDEFGNVTNLKEAGEVVYTDLSPKALPLIRYRLDDIAVLDQEKCPCGNNLIFATEGRNQSEYLKLPDFTISSRTISNALENLLDLIEPRFQMHIHAGNKLTFEIYLQPISKILNPDKLSEEISQKLILKNNETLADFVSKNKAYPLKIKWINDWGSSTAKAKSIVYYE